MDKNTSLRLATIKDFDQLADLRWRLRTDDTEVVDAGERNKFRNAFVGILSGNSLSDYYHWVAEVEDHLVAVMSLHVVRQLPAPERLNGGWGYLTNCYVLPGYRNQGIGRRLLEHVRQWSKEQRLEIIVVWAQ